MLKKLVGKYNDLPIQARASFWFLICTFTQKVINVITVPIFTRLMTTFEYGEYNVYTSWLGIFTVFISLNLSLGGFVRGLIKFSDRKNEFASSMQSLTLILVIAWIIIYLPFSSQINKLTGLNTTKTLLMITTIWLTSVFGFWAAEQRVDYQYKKLVPITLSVAIGGQALGVALFYVLKDKVCARILGIVIVDALVYFWLFGLDLFRGRRIFDWEFWRYSLFFNLPLVPHYLSQVVLNSSDRIMIDRMVGSRAAGIYGVAYSISQVMTMFNIALFQTVEPWLYRKINEKKIEDIRPIAYISFILIASVNLVLIIFAPEIISIFAPMEYYEAIWVIPPIAMSVFFSFSYYFFAVFEYYYENTKPIAIASCIGAILNVALNYLLIPIYGYYVAGYTTLVCFIVYTFFHYIFMHRICIENLNGMEPFSISVFILISILFIVCGFVISITYHISPFVRYVIAIVFLMILIIHKNRLFDLVKKIMSMRSTK